MPGVVMWTARLIRDGILPQGLVRFKTVSAKYADKDFFIDDIFSDSMAFSGEMLSEKGSDWIPAVIEQVEISNALVIQLANLAQSIAKAAGDSDGTFIRDAAKEQAYFALDMPFRSWLAGIDPAQEKLPEALVEYSTADCAQVGCGTYCSGRAAGACGQGSRPEKHSCAGCI